MAETNIHPTAIVDKGAQLGTGVNIGPFCTVGPEVVLGDRTRLISHVVLMGATTLGEDCTVYPNAVLGGPPQNTKHKGGRTTLEIGRNCTIREGVTFHLGTDTSRGKTTVGNDGNFLAYCHVAHDCDIGNNVTMANGALLGGHCELGDHVIMGGMTAVHQFTRIGHHAFIGGGSALGGDVIPFGIVSGNRAMLRGLNVVGMKRAGMARSDILNLRKAVRTIFKPGNEVTANLEEARQEFAGSALVAEVIEFIENRGKRYLCVPPLGTGGDPDDQF